MGESFGEEHKVTLNNALQLHGETDDQVTDQSLLVDLGNGHGVEVPLDGQVTLHDQATGETELANGRDVGEGSSTVVTRGENGSIKVEKTITGKVDNVVGVQLGSIDRR